MFVSNPWKGKKTAMKNPQIYCTFFNKDASSFLLSLGCPQALLLAEMCEFSSSCRDFGDGESGVQILRVTSKIHKELFPQSRHIICKPGEYWKANPKGCVELKTVTTICCLHPPANNPTIVTVRWVNIVKLPRYFSMWRGKERTKIFSQSLRLNCWRSNSQQGQEAG